MNFLEHHSPSSCNLFSADLAMFVTEKIFGKKQQVGTIAYRGTAVERGVIQGLNHPDASIKECVDVALIEFDYLSAMSTDKRRDHVRDGIPEMVAHAILELRPLGKPYDVQGFVEARIGGLDLPIIGYFDFAFTTPEQAQVIVDLKTTERLPSEIKIAHARQVALYAKAMNAAGWLTYVTPKKIATYNLENIDEHFNALVTIAKKVEGFISLSDDPNFYLGITSPNLDSFYWGSPESRQLAYDMWKV